MQVPFAIAAKIGNEPTLLGWLRNCGPEDMVPQSILVFLNVPEFPKSSGRDFTPLPPDELAEMNRKIAEVGDKAADGFASIQGLQVFNLMKNIGCASVQGTAGALIKMLELDCVKEAAIGDRMDIRGASMG